MKLKTRQPRANLGVATPIWGMLNPIVLLLVLSCHTDAPSPRGLSRDPMLEAFKEAAAWPNARDEVVLSLATQFFASRREEDGYRYFAAAQADGILLGPNPAWPEAMFVDLRSPRWASLILDQVVPDILARGFDGVFLDTLDDSEHLEDQDPQRFAGMVDAAAALVRAMRRRMPRRPIMVNRAYAVLPRIVGAFDMLLGESVRAKHVGESEGGGYALTTDPDYHWQRDRMWEARDRDRALRVFSLDYWDPEDRAGVARLYAEQYRNGFVPYVATRDLTRIIPPPLPEVP